MLFWQQYRNPASLTVILHPSIFHETMYISPMAATSCSIWAIGSTLQSVMCNRESARNAMLNDLLSCSLLFPCCGILSLSFSRICDELFTVYPCKHAGCWGPRSMAGESHSWCLTLKVLNFWKLTSYCSLKPLWSGMEEVVPARTSPTLHPPSPPTVHQLSWPAL